jgi:cytochrome c-type biogenesis protein CcmH/NrfG
MVGAVATAFVLAFTLQSIVAPQDRNQAEDLARSGRTAEALRVFRRIVEQNPADLDARMWTAVLELRLGRTREAEAAFRAVIRAQPSHVGARIGLGAALTRQGNWADALSQLHEVEREAGENSDLIAALGRAYRRAGDDRRALDYFARAKSLAGNDPDIADDYEATARAYGHFIAVDGFGEQRSDATAASAGSFTMSLRAVPTLHLFTLVRLDHRAGASETIVGGGLRWRAARATTVVARAMGGSGNSSLPNADLSADVIQQIGFFEAGGSVRTLSFAGTDVVALSPIVSVDRGGRLRLDARYTYSRSSFDATGETSGDHSVLVRPTWRAWRRVALSATYAYGIESFEDLTADRLGALGATTFTAGVRISLRSLTVVNGAWEHQWRSNNTSVDRLLLGMVQSFR